MYKLASQNRKVLELSNLRNFSKAFAELSEYIVVSDGKIGHTSNVTHRHALLKLGHDNKGDTYLSQNLSTTSRYGFSVGIEKGNTSTNYLRTGQLLATDN
jgi:hypothetical protein